MGAPCGSSQCTPSAENEGEFMAYPSYRVFELHVSFHCDVKRTGYSHENVRLRLPKVHVITITSHINRKSTPKMKYYNSRQSCKPHLQDYA
jgi:hypothetical protein